MDIRSINNFNSPVYLQAQVSAVPESGTPLPEETFQSVTSSGAGSCSQVLSPDIIKTAVLGDLKPGVNIRWEESLGPHNLLNGVSPVIRDDGIYLNVSGGIRKLDYNGKELFSKSVGNSNTSEISFDTKGNLYVSTTKKLCSFQPDGGVRWEKTKEDGINQFFPPVVGEDKVFVFGNEKKNSLTCYTSDGDEKWTVQLDHRHYRRPLLDDNGILHVHEDDTRNRKQPHVSINTRKTGIFGNPKVKRQGEFDEHHTIAVDTRGNQYGWIDNKFRSMDKDGNERWTLKDSVPDRPYHPEIGLDGKIYLRVGGETMLCLDPDNGSEKWRMEKDGVTEAILGVSFGKSGAAYVETLGDQAGLYAINPDGSERWHVKDGAQFIGVLETADGSVYATHPFRKFDGATGEKLGDYSRELGSVVSCQEMPGGDLLVLNESRELRRVCIASKKDVLQRAVEKSGDSPGKPEITRNAEESVDVDGAQLKKRRKRYFHAAAPARSFRKSE